MIPAVAGHRQCPMGRRDRGTGGIKEQGEERQNRAPDGEAVGAAVGLSVRTEDGRTNGRKEGKKRERKEKRMEDRREAGRAVM